MTSQKRSPTSLNTRRRRPKYRPSRGTRASGRSQLMMGSSGPTVMGSGATTIDRRTPSSHHLEGTPWRRRRRSVVTPSARSSRPSGRQQQPYSRRRRPYNKRTTPRSARAASSRAATRHWCPAAMYCAAGASRRTSNATTPTRAPSAARPCSTPCAYSYDKIFTRSAAYPGTPAR